MPGVLTNSNIKNNIITLNTRLRASLFVAIKILVEFNEARHQLKFIAYILNGLLRQCDRICLKDALMEVGGILLVELCSFNRDVGV